MSKFLLITKINLLSIFNLGKLFSFKSKNDKRKKIFKSLIIILILLYLAFSIYMATRELMPVFISINKPLYLLSLLFAICSAYIFIANIFKIKDLLFDFKDYDLLMSLPVGRNMVLASKITSLYITNLLYTLVIMIPGYLAYISFLDLPHDWLFFVLLPTIPIIPILLSSIISIIITWITSMFSNKNIGSYVVNILLIASVLFFYFNMYSIDTNQVVNNSVNIVNSFSKYYPLTSVFASLLEEISLTSLLIYFIVPIILTGIFIVIIDLSYIRLRTRLLRQNVKNNYRIVKYTTNSSLFSLYKKELKKYFSNSLYVINTAFGCILVFVLIIAILLFKDNAINYFSKITGFSDTIKTNVFVILSLLCALSSTTNSSLSLEGKSFWIVKMLPVSTSKIFLSKILVNLTILIPTIIVGGTFFGIYLHLSPIEFLYIYLTPLSYALFASIGGLLLNVIFPRFDYENELRVIKQSLSVFLTIVIGLSLSIIPFAIAEVSIGYIIVVTAAMFVIDVFIALVLRIYGEGKVKRL